jgi:hypothetical protein
LGWTVGQNIRLEFCWGDGKADSVRKHAAELVALAPDVILANSSAAVSPLLGPVFSYGRLCTRTEQNQTRNTVQ